MRCAHCGERIERAPREFAGLVAIAWRHVNGRMFCYAKGFQTAFPAYEGADA